MQIFLDIGMPKTGSKARQQFFLDEPSRIKETRLLYPASGRSWLWHRPLHEALVAGRTDVPDALRHEIATARDDGATVIISYEEMYTLDSGKIGVLRDLGDQVRAIIFLRRQDQLVNSYYNQQHKAHRISINDLRNFERTMLDWDAAFDYRKILQRWASVLGTQNIIPIIFDKSKPSNLQFCTAAKLRFEASVQQEAYTNTAMDAYGLAVLREVKRIVGDSELLEAAVREAHSALRDHFVAARPDSEYYLLNLAQRRQLLAHYERGNEWVRENYFPDRTQLFDDPEEGQMIAIDQHQGKDLAEQIVERAISQSTARDTGWESGALATVKTVARRIQHVFRSKAN